MFAHIVYQKNIFSLAGNPYKAGHVYGTVADGFNPTQADEIADNDGILITDNDGVQLIDNN